ncbi:MAG: hypothetical protein JXR76_12250 [Deltaproteobacteria bacterium]|nr:hypothetical protein [Deltaproteobacteria bacterium]
MKKALIILGFSLFAVSCFPSQYTHIEKVDEGYILTKNKGGFFKAHGEVWKCTPKAETTFSCKRTALK